METRLHWFVCFQVILAYESIVLCKCSGNVLIGYSSAIEKNFSILEGVAEALKVCESILIPKSVICQDGVRVDFSRLTTIPSS